MSDDPSRKPSDKDMPLSRKIEIRAARKLRAQRHVSRTIWFGLGTMGVVGWSVAIPSLVGTLLGVWLDQRYPGNHSWTIMLLMGGLILGAVNAWRWISKENQAMQDEQEDPHE